MLSTKDNDVYNIHTMYDTRSCLQVVMVLDSQTICFQFGMQIGNEATVSVYLLFGMTLTLLPPCRVLSPALGSGWGAC